MTLTESIVEDAALEWFGERGYAFGHGPQMAPGELIAERASFTDVILPVRLRTAIQRLNPSVPPEAREDALRKVLRIGFRTGVDELQISLAPSVPVINVIAHILRRL